MKAIKWAMVYGGLYVERFDDVEDAMRSALLASDLGIESLLHIECEDGELIDFRHPRLIAFEERQEALANARMATYSPTHVVRVKATDGQWSAPMGVDTIERAEALADMYADVVGPDRVRIERRGQ